MKYLVEFKQAKTRETLELALGEAQMQKYEEGLTDEQLTGKINSMGEDAKDGTKPNISQAIVDGHIFEIDRTVPKILDYIGHANGVVITTTVSGNNGSYSDTAITGYVERSSQYIYTICRTGSRLSSPGCMSEIIYV